MPRTVVPNAQVAHLWAAQSQPSARSGNGNFYFEGPTLWSYGSHFPVGTFVVNQRGERAVFWHDDRYSVSTAKHISYGHRAVCGLGVPEFAVSKGCIPLWGRPVPNVEACMDYSVKLAGEFAAKAKRARSNSEWLAKCAHKMIDQAWALAEFFGVEAPASLVSGDLQAAVAEARAKAKRAEAQAQAAREQREAAARARYLVEIDAWVRGETDHAPYTPAEDTRLRLKGGDVQTSRGAVVPLKAALRLYHTAEAHRAQNVGKPGAASSYLSFGDRAFAVGPYALRRIHFNGDCQIGCHYLRFEEMARLAGRLLPVPVS